ncbi:RNA-directed DNA polymerase, eukaryota, reverse transcriptase zinc-binding domain protein [Tanacetum coccineum]|uniref:RNA-directed DNA polymerase, eukaryota, reverse transcriptase zinc-binding domain protein n=1 Tax=Tanacetum coccineum TaxID=301880 RepID=A0ABQ5DM40_9ASTR
MPDSHKHLFFECDFPKEVWCRIKTMARLEHAPNSWFNIIDFLLKRPINKSIWIVLQSLVLGASVYALWQERNLRTFQGSNRSLEEVCNKIKDVVDYSTVFIFWQLMFVDNKLAAGMELESTECWCTSTWKMGHWLKMGLACHVSGITDLLHVLKCFPICNKEGEDLSASIVVPSKVVVDKDDETLALVFDEALGVGDGVSEIKFSGVLNERMNGFYIKGVIFTSKML